MKEVKSPVKTENVIPFKCEEFGAIRTMIIDNEPWFVGKDVAEALGYEAPRSAVSKKVESEDRGVAKMKTPSGIQEMTIINESGLYSLILSSKLSQAKKFKHWVTSEVLPSIRKTGSYSMAVPKTFAEALYLAAKQQEQIEEQQRTIELQQKKIEEDAPHVQFSEAVLAPEKAILISTLAKMIAQNGIEIGGKRLFEWMRKNEYLGTSGRNKNIPTQKTIDLGVLFIEERTIDTGWDSRIVRTPMVTGKGQKYFINKFLMQENH